MTYTAGQMIEFSDGSAIRIDRVTDAWIYFVQWRPFENTGAPVRMAPTVFAEAVATYRAKTEPTP